jgi:hypothetical protein
MVSKWRCIPALVIFMASNACTKKAENLDFCRILAAAPEFQSKLFRADIVVIPNIHQDFAVAPGCQERKVLTFAPGSFSESPGLVDLRRAIDKAYLAPGSQASPRGKAVSVRVTAKVVKVSTPRAGYALRLLQAEHISIVDALDLGDPTEGLTPSEN